jgi:hypothetical protein
MLSGPGRPSRRTHVNVRKRNPPRVTDLIAAYTFFPWGRDAN